MPSSLYEYALSLLKDSSQTSQVYCRPSNTPRHQDQPGQLEASSNSIVSKKLTPFMSLVIDIDLGSLCLLLHSKVPIGAASGLSVVREFASI